MYLLKLNDGTNSIDFLTKEFLLENAGFEIRTPRKKQLWGGGTIFSHGESLVSSKYENRKLRITFSITGATRDEFNSNASDLERLLTVARRRAVEQQGNRVELQYQIDGASQVTYFEVIDGTLAFPKNLMSVEQVLQTDSAGRFTVEKFVLELITHPFGFSISPVNGSPVEVPLTNGNGTDVTGGLAVVNHDDSDSGHDNWVEIKAADIADSEQELDTILRLKGNVFIAGRTQKFYIGHRTGNTDFTHILEDDDADYVNGSPTPTVDTDASGGTYSQVTHADTDGIALLFRWDLTATEAAKTQGPFRLFGRVTEGASWDEDASYWIRFTLSGVIFLATGKRVKPISSNVEFLDFGTFHLPPGFPSPALDPVDEDILPFEIALYGEYDVGVGTATVNFDYLMLLPLDGGYRVLQFPVLGLVGDDYVVDDGWEDHVYYMSADADNYKLSFPVGLLSRIRLIPNQDQRLYIVQESDTKNCQIDRGLDVELFKIPRYTGLI